jgi:hypothetical protein
MSEKTEGAIKYLQPEETGTIGHTRHETETSNTQKYNTAHQTKKSTKRDPTKSSG